MERNRQEVLSPLILDIETTGLDPFESRVVAVGYTNSDVRKVLMDENEHELLKSFMEDIIGKNYVFVGYNIQYFDLPFLTARLLKNEESLAARDLRRFYRVDLMTVVQRYLRTNRKYCKLQEVCDFLGFRVPDDRTGSDIPLLYEKGNLEEIRRHCIADLRKTYELYLRLHPLCVHNLFVRYGVQIKLGR